MSYKSKNHSVEPSYLLVASSNTSIELSTRSDAHDVVNVTFIFTGRWIGAG